MKVNVVQRPYLFVYDKRHSQLVTSEEAQRVINECKVVSATTTKVVLEGFSGDYGEPWTFFVQPATYGGGPGFEITND